MKTQKSDPEPIYVVDKTVLEYYIKDIKGLVRQYECNVLVNHYMHCAGFE